MKRFVRRQQGMAVSAIVIRQLVRLLGDIDMSVDAIRLRGGDVVVSAVVGQPRQRVIVTTTVPWALCEAATSVHDLHLHRVWLAAADNIAAQYRGEVDPDLIGLLVGGPYVEPTVNPVEQLLGKAQPLSRWDKLLGDYDLLSEVQS